MGLKAAVCKQDELTPGNMLGTHVGPVPVVVIRTPDGELHVWLTSACTREAPFLRENLRACMTQGLAQ